MDKLKELLISETIYKPSDEVIDEFLSYAEEKIFEPYEPVIDIDTVNPDIYILKDGVLFKSVFNNGQEITHSFATPGTMAVSYDSMLMGEPSRVRIATCCRCTILHIRKEDYQKMIDTRPDFVKWMLGMSQYQLYATDVKTSIVQGDAMLRYKRLMTVRPDILRYVPLKMIASYLGITQQHLSRIRATLKTAK